MTFGVVPDKVATVVLLLTHHRTMRVPVHANAWIAGPSVQQSESDPPGGIVGFHWLDRNGRRLPDPHAPPDRRSSAVPR
jgi:hypothetical protein